MTLGYAWFKYFKLLIYSLSCWLSKECCLEIEKAKKCKSKPTAIILDTIKGKGVSFIEAMGISNHSTNISQEQLQLALEELK